MGSIKIETFIPSDLYIFLRRLQKERNEPNASTIMREALYKLLRQEYGVELNQTLKASTKELCLPR